VFHGTDWESRVGISRSRDGWALAIDDQPVPFRWHHGPDDLWQIERGDDVARFSIRPVGASMEISGNGGRWIVASGPRPVVNESKRRQRSDGRVKAPLPGKVLRINVAPGDHVEAGHPIVTLSAMKMELVCDAPITGTIEAINCQIDQIVAADDILAVINVGAIS
jgi:biotin carboxyl carrier protein